MIPAEGAKTNPFASSKMPESQAVCATPEATCLSELTPQQLKSGLAAWLG